MAIQLSGGHAGPDGIEADAEAGLLVCHLGIGVWRFDARMLPTHLVLPPADETHVTNLAFHPARPHELYMTASLTGCVLTARMPVPGRPAVAHSPANGQPSPDLST